MRDDRIPASFPYERWNKTGAAKLGGFTAKYKARKHSKVFA